MMPGIGFEEMILLVLVAIVVIGPKDLPLMMRKFGRFTGKMRAMAFEFKQGFDELGRQAELDELRKEVADLKNSTGLGDLRREFEEDQRALEADVNSALAATDPTPAQPGQPATSATTTPAVAGAAAVAAVATTGEATAAPAEVAPVIPAPGMGENGLPLVKAQDRFPKPVRKQPTPRPAAEAAPYAGLSADHPGYDAGEDFRIDGAAPAPQPTPDTPQPDALVNGEAAGDVHVIPDDHVRPTHPAAERARQAGYTCLMNTPVVTAADKQKAAAIHAKAAPAPEVDEVEASRAPLMDHLLELRDRLVRILWVVGVLFLGGWYVTEYVLAFLLQPLSDAAHRAGRPLSETIETVATAPMEMIFVKLKMSFLLAIAVGFPFIAYQIYAFVAPGLYKNERAAVLPYLFLMPILFVAGGWLVYQFVLPTFMDLSFSQEFTANGAKVVYLPKIKEYYELAISLLTCFGFAFQLPIVMSLLARAGVVHAPMLRKGRKFALVVIVFAAMFMTPPDPFSWVILSVPLFLLYESGIIAAMLIERGKKRREAAEAKREEAEAKREAAEEAKRSAAAAAASSGAAAPGE